MGNRFWAGVTSLATQKTKNAIAHGGSLDDRRTRKPLDKREIQTAARCIDLKHSPNYGICFIGNSI